MSPKIERYCFYCGNKATHFINDNRCKTYICAKEIPEISLSKGATIHKLDEV